MAETKWTPGPWRACVWDPMERPHVHKDIEGQTHCGPKHDLPFNAADAHLIASAPKMYDALEKALRYIKHHKNAPLGDRIVMRREALDSIQSAMGDARGEQ